MARKTNDGTTMNTEPGHNLEELEQEGSKRSERLQPQSRMIKDQMQDHSMQLFSV